MSDGPFFLSNNAALARLVPLHRLEHGGLVCAVLSGVGNVDGDESLGRAGGERTKQALPVFYGDEAVTGAVDPRDRDAGLGR